MGQSPADYVRSVGGLSPPEGLVTRQRKRIGRWHTEALLAAKGVGHAPAPDHLLASPHHARPSVRRGGGVAGAGGPDDRSARSAVSTYQESNANLVYSPAWKAVRNAKCSDGSMRTRYATGSVTATFTGTGVSVYVAKGPAYGIMEVTLDGVARYASVCTPRPPPTGGRPLQDRPGQRPAHTHAGIGRHQGRSRLGQDGRPRRPRVQGRLIGVPTSTPTPTPTPTVAPTGCPARHTRRPTRICAISASGAASAGRDFSGGTQNR